MTNESRDTLDDDTPIGQQRPEALPPYDTSIARRCIQCGGNFHRSLAMIPPWLNAGAFVDAACRDERARVLYLDMVAEREAWVDDQIISAQERLEHGLGHRLMDRCEAVVARERLADMRKERRALQSQLVVKASGNMRKTLKPDKTLLERISAAYSGPGRANRSAAEPPTPAAAAGEVEDATEGAGEGLSLNAQWAAGEGSTLALGSHIATISKGGTSGLVKGVQACPVGAAAVSPTMHERQAQVDAQAATSDSPPAVPFGRPVSPVVNYDLSVFRTTSTSEDRSADTTLSAATSGSAPDPKVQGVTVVAEQTQDAMLAAKGDVVADVAVGKANTPKLGDASYVPKEGEEGYLSPEMSARLADWSR